MHSHCRLALIVIALLFCMPAQAQDRTAEISPALRAQVYELLTYQCGVAEVEDRFRQTIAKLGPAAEPLLLSVLSDGLPPEVRKAAQRRAAARFDRRQAWLAENGGKLFGDDTNRLAKRDRPGFVGDAVRRVEALYRENAVRGLGIVGSGRAAAAIEAAATRHPDLSILAERSLNEIRRRQ